MNITKKKIAGIPVVFLALAIVGSGVAGAALLNVYTSTEGNVDIQQSVVFSDGSSSMTYEASEPAGDINVHTQTIKNRSTQSEAPFEMNTTQNGGDVEGISTTYYDYEKKEWMLEVVGDEDSEDFGELYATANPKKDRVIYNVELPSDYFQSGPANINFEISPTADSDENNFQVTLFPSQEDWDWRFVSPSVDKNVKVYGKSDVEARPEVRSVQFDNNSEEPSVVKVVTTNPSGNQSFMVHASDGGETYKSIGTPGYEGYANKSISGHLLVANEVTEGVLQPQESLDMAIVNEFDVALESGDYTITSEVIPK